MDTHTRAVMRHLRDDDNIKSWVCQFCGEPFPYDAHPEVIRHHLIWKCGRAPEDVKEAAQRIEEHEFSISVEGNGSNFNAQTEGSRYAGRQVEVAECSISVNWEPRRILDASEHNDSNSEAEIESNIVQQNKRQKTMTGYIPPPSNLPPVETEAMTMQVLPDDAWRELERHVFGGASSLILTPEEEVMENPRVAADGYTYEEEAIKGWIERGYGISPMTNLNLDHVNLVPNHTLRSAIREWEQRRR